MPHFRAGHAPSSGEELQSEYFVPRSSAGDALAALRSIAAQLAAVVQVNEIRTIAADELWLSGAYKMDAVGFHFAWIPDAERVRPVVALVERTLAPYSPRPHWAKVFDEAKLAARIEDVYEKLGDFRRLAAAVDPERVFVNDWLERVGVLPLV